MHKSPDTAGALYRGYQGADQQSENNNPGISRICKNINHAVQPTGNACQGIELIQQRMPHPDTGEERQDDLLAPDGEDDCNNRRKDGMPAWISHYSFSIAGTDNFCLRIEAIPGKPIGNYAE